MAKDVTTGQISEEQAALVLDRAAKLDARGGKWLDVAELRDAALEAGISLEAFERALGEVEALSRSAGSAPATASSATGATDESTPAAARRAGMLAAGCVLGGLALLLGRAFGLGDAGITFTLLIALGVVISSVYNHHRRRDVMAFEVELGFLWVGLTFMLMLSGPPEDVLFVMGRLWALTAAGGGVAIAIASGAGKPKELPDRT